MADESIIITKVKSTKSKKKPSDLETPVIESIGSDSIGPVVPQVVIPVPPVVPQVVITPPVETPRKPRAKSAKAIAKAEIIQVEKMMKQEQLKAEQDMRNRALEEIQKLETLKAQLLREEIQKQIQAEARGEVKRTRKTQESSSALVEKKKTTKNIVKDLMPEKVEMPSVGSSRPPQPQVQTRAPVGNIFSSKFGRTYF